MSAPETRRGFLRGLTTLPLVGGGMALLGAPTAVAEPVTHKMLSAYDTFLVYERCKLKAEMYGPGAYWSGVPGNDEMVRIAVGHIPFDNGAVPFHFPCNGEPLPPSTRAALVLSAVGCDWRRGGL